MSVALAAMVSRLESQAPVRDSVPADYGQVVKDAVWQLSEDVPMVKRSTLAIVSGTATYSLPSDFLFMIELERFAQEEVLITDSGLVPMGADYRDRFTVVGDQITFYPTPVYTATRYYRYGAAYILDGSEIYQSMNENGARIALLYGAHLVLSEQAAASGGGWRYQIGDEMVDKSKVGAGLQGQAEAKLKQYQAAVSQQKRFGVLGRVEYGGESV